MGVAVYEGRDGYPAGADGAGLPRFRVADDGLFRAGGHYQASVHEDGGVPDEADPALGPA